SEKPGTIEARLRRFDGEYRWFLFRAEPCRNENGVVVRWYGPITEIEDLNCARKEFFDVIDYTPLHAAIPADDGSRLYANRVALEYSGISVEEFQSDGYERKYIHPDDLETLKSETAAARAETYELEFRVRGKDGRFRWFLVRFLPLRDHRG